MYFVHFFFFGLKLLRCNQGLKFRIYRPIYRISGLIETIFDTENRLQEKSRNIGEYRRYFGEISDFDRNIGGWETRARGNFFGFFWEIYRRYIGNIGDISEISVKISEIYRDISGYIENISK